MNVMNMLVTAGPTREYLDPVRFLSNSSSGNTGYEIAAAGRDRGHRVILISGPVALEPPRGVELIDVISADQMHQACLDVLPAVEAVVMTAAVCDYKPQRCRRHKLKKSADAMDLHLVSTPDILSDLGSRKLSGQILVGFALEDRQPRTSAKAKFVRKNLDAIVLNAPSALGSSRNQVSVYYAGEWHDWPTMTKRALGKRIIRLTERLFATR